MKKVLTYFLILVCTLANAGADSLDFDSYLATRNEIVDDGAKTAFESLALGDEANDSAPKCSGEGGFCGCQAYHTGSECWKTAIWCCEGLSCVGGGSAYSGKCEPNRD